MGQGEGKGRGPTVQGVQCETTAVRNQATQEVACGL